MTSALERGRSEAQETDQNIFLEELKSREGEVPPKAFKSRVMYFFAGLDLRFPVDRDYSVGHVTTSLERHGRKRKEWSVVHEFSVNGAMLAQYKEDLVAPKGEQQGKVIKRHYAISGVDEDKNGIQLNLSEDDNDPGVVSGLRYIELSEEKNSPEEILSPRVTLITSEILTGKDLIKVARHMGVRF